jgi:hypothetical protein
MNRFQFIKHLLDTKKFSLSQKERFLKLVSQELISLDENDVRNAKDIKQIKKQLGLSDVDEKKKPRLRDLLESKNSSKSSHYSDHNTIKSTREISLEEIEELFEKAGGKSMFDDTNENSISSEQIKSDSDLMAKPAINVEEPVVEYVFGNTIEKINYSEEFKPLKEQKKVPEPNPKHVADFMALFNQRNGLKYLTHDYDENSDFEIDKFLISAKKVFDNETYNNLKIPKSLWRIVKQFAFDSEQTEWTSISEDYKKPLPLKIGWATKELREWSKLNHLHPIRNEEYKKIINDFKRITRIETSNLEKLINITLDSVFEKEIDNFDIVKIDLSKADFYSHVGFLKKAFETIFEEIKKRSDSPLKRKITIKYERSISDDGYYMRKVKLTHHKSFPEKELKLILKEWQEKGNMGKIRESLLGYCHWSVETNIEDIPTRVNILREKNTAEYQQIENDPDGFTHVLTFYYK